MRALEKQVEKRGYEIVHAVRGSGERSLEEVLGRMRKDEKDVERREVNGVIVRYARCDEIRWMSSEIVAGARV